MFFFQNDCWNVKCCYKMFVLSMFSIFNIENFFIGILSHLFSSFALTSAPFSKIAFTVKLQKSPIFINEEGRFSLSSRKFKRLYIKVKFFYKKWYVKFFNIMQIYVFCFQMSVEMLSVVRKCLFSQCLEFLTLKIFS